ncbi:ufm1-specific protease 2 [Trichonephila clavata]|uniref:Probable Ufm1-specific protease 2 n=1 Tax=Trichonephila clavata TaxID=2740835 RepID=A0A8X6H2T9_TRICU|nr:ufm1-specific protease 2 [Trichonephila clavata]
MECQAKKIRLSNKVKKSFSVTDESLGCIVGWDTEAETFCMGISASTEHLLPGLEAVGFFCEIDGDLAVNELLGICEQRFGALQLELENPVVLFVWKEKENNEVNITAKLYSSYYGTLADLSISNIDQNSSVLVRACGQVPLIIELASDLETLKENVELAVEKLRTVFQSRVVAFILQNSPLMIHSFQETSGISMKELLKIVAETESNETVKAKKTMKKKCPVNFNILMQTSGDAALENNFNHSVVIHCQRREFRCISLSIPLDVIVVDHESSSTNNIYKLLQNAIDQQLIKISQCLLTHIKSLEDMLPEPHHFYPDIWEFPITLIYPSNKTDKELEICRKELHKQLLLPMDRPFLKKLNSYDFSLTSSTGHLFNPHEGINTTGVTGGKRALVYGKYSYHHYMQDHMNDNGWGCAYRSLQTIISWFKYQGYTNRSIPTHTEIQEALVAVGDKPQSFIGSNKWIGSQEVSFCLDHLLQIQSKIMFVSSGAELANKGRELFYHFRDQGTPVMIGGGVLAHTIIGVDFNQDTGDLKFLILDPHYTGSEDLHVILNKGWCGWKGVQFWDQNAFYNLCLPQRPIEI